MKTRENSLQPSSPPLTSLPGVRLSFAIIRKHATQTLKVTFILSVPQVPIPDQTAYSELLWAKVVVASFLPLCVQHRHADSGDLVMTDERVTEGIRDGQGSILFSKAQLPWKLASSRPASSSYQCPCRPLFFPQQQRLLRLCSLESFRSLTALGKS